MRETSLIDAAEQGGEPERRIGSVLKQTFLARRRVTAVVGTSERE